MSAKPSQTQTFRKFMRAAYDAAAMSNDKHTHNGAIIVDMSDGRAVAGGCNMIPEEIATDPDRFERPAKYKYTVHAEQTAIYLAARMGVPVDKKWMFSTWAACDECARAIVMAGIRHLVRHKLPTHAEHSQWAESIKLGDEILEEAGIEVIDLEATVGRKNLFNGQLVNV